MAELSSALPPLGSHLKCGMHFMHAYSPELKTEVTACSEQTRCWPLLQESLSIYVSGLAVTDKEPFIFCYFSSRATEILIPTLAAFLWMISYLLVFRNAMTRSKQPENPRAKVPSDLLPHTPISIPVSTALCMPHLSSTMKVLLSFSAHSPASRNSKDLSRAGQTLRRSGVDGKKETGRGRCNNSVILALHNLEISPQYSHGTGVISWKTWP